MRYFLQHRIAAAAFLLGTLFIAPHPILSQTSTESTRKIVTRISPQYPSLARSMNLQGSVKADVVKSVEIKGGHPLLVQAAQNALRGWKWEPAPHETHEVVELKFML
jgi:outer membrane biosynthesis protein TonB